MQKSKIKNGVSKKNIYLDNASTTRINLSVLRKMFICCDKYFANPDSIHDIGLYSKIELDRIRKEFGFILGCSSSEIIFTSGSTESNNLVIYGVIENYFLNNKFGIPHVIISNIEHPSVFELVNVLSKRKRIRFSYLKVNEFGLVNPKDLRSLINKDTVLVSVMYANNEIGTIQPIRDIAKEIRHWNKNNKNKVLFHTDATQAVNYLPIRAESLGVDLMSFNAHKIYGPKGIGILFKKGDVKISPFILGGSQEFGLRAGTSNLPLCLGFLESLKIVENIKIKESKRLVLLRDYFIKNLLKFNNLYINGDLKERLPNNINITFEKIPSDLIVVELSALGVYVSEKSACKSRDKESSHVIRALRDKETGSIRFSLGRDTKKNDIDFVLKSIDKVLKKLLVWYN